MGGMMASRVFGHGGLPVYVAVLLGEGAELGYDTLPPPHEFAYATLSSLRVGHDQSRREFTEALPLVRRGVADHPGIRNGNMPRSWTFPGRIAEMARSGS